MPVINSKQVTTRVQHRCYGCNKRFPRGSNMTLTLSRIDGDLLSDYWCKDCQAFIESNWIDWENTSKGEIGHWKDGVWYPSCP